MGGLLACTLGAILAGSGPAMVALAMSQRARVKALDPAAPGGSTGLLVFGAIVTVIGCALAFVLLDYSLSNHR